MARPKTVPLDREVFFGEEEIIVSKTDLRGVITYANDVFLRVAGYTEEEALGQQHNCIRHPDMPRCVFKLLWDTLNGGSEIFAYVKNMAKSGAFYWVFAHVTPSYDGGGRVIGYHSNRRVPRAIALDQVKPLYAKLLEIEAAAGDPKRGMETATAFLLEQLESAGVDYDEFVISLAPQVTESV